MEKQQFKYFAFISYNQKDYGWGKKLQRKLEGYKMPSTLCSQHGWAKQPIKPVFLPLQIFSQGNFRKNYNNDFVHHEILLLYARQIQPRAYGWDVK